MGNGGERSFEAWGENVGNWGRRWGRLIIRREWGESGILT